MSSASKFAATRARATIVIRREFDVSEGDAFNQVLIQRAKRRLEALDFFERVEISTAPGSEPDQVILVVDVVEKSTGEFSIGAGYSTGGETAGPSIEGSITERNFLGRGQYIRLSAGGGENSRDFMLSFTEPYFLGRRIAAGFDIFRQTRQYDDYESETTGGDDPLRPADHRDPVDPDRLQSFAGRVRLRRQLRLIDGAISTRSDCNVSPAIIDGVANSPWIKSSVSGTLLYNTIDDMKNPHAGIYRNMSTSKLPAWAATPNS